jgi:hypothetical protein
MRQPLHHAVQSLWRQRPDLEADKLAQHVEPFSEAAPVDPASSGPAAERRLKNGTCDGGYRKRRQNRDDRRRECPERAHRKSPTRCLPAG